MLPIVPSTEAAFPLCTAMDSRCRRNAVGLTSPDTRRMRRPSSTRNFLDRSPITLVVSVATGSNWWLESGYSCASSPLLELQQLLLPCSWWKDIVINPRRACAARVTVVVLCVSVCLSVCHPLFSHYRLRGGL